MNIHIILYIVTAIVCIFLAFRVYLKVKHPFWSQQPVFHYYNIKYWLAPPGIISKDPPSLSKYVNDLNVKFHTINDTPDSLFTRCVAFIKSNYMRTKMCNYIPDIKHVKPYFEGHLYKSFVSSYMDSEVSRDIQKGSIVTDRIMGIMTTRPVYLIHKKRKRPVYYVDYLCVGKSDRRRDIAPMVIQTHHYHQRREEPSIHVSMFKREGALTNIVPLCAYPTRTFEIGNVLQDWRKPNLSTFRIVPVSNNIELIERMIHSAYKQTPYVIHSNLINIQRLIETNNIHTFCLHDGEEPIGMFFLRNMMCSYDGGYTVSLFASIGVDDVRDAMAWGAMESLKILAKTKGYQHVCIEEVGDTISWLDLAVGRIGVRDSCPPSPTAYYMYNFGMRPIAAKDITIVL